MRKKLFKQGAFLTWIKEQKCFISNKTFIRETWKTILGNLENLSKTQDEKTPPFRLEAGFISRNQFYLLDVCIG